MEISLCMIVKDEEAILERCLDSIAGLMDEIIIVDTGSADSTKEIAGKYTDNIYDFKWIDDFSAARNFSFSKATKDYIYAADADEVLDKENYKRFRELKETLLPEIDIVQMKYGNQLQYGTAYNFDEEYRPKLFKRLRTFVWEEPVHEMIRLSPVVYDSDIVLLHLPKNNHAGRDFMTFQKYIANGGRLSKRLHHMYAMELFISGEDADFKKAGKFFERSALDSSRSLDEIKEASCIAVKAARLGNDVSTILKMCLKDLMSEGSSEMCCELGAYFYGIGDYQEAVVWYYNAVYETLPILNINYSNKIPLQGLVDSHTKLGNIKEAEMYKGEM